MRLIISAIEARYMRLGVCLKLPRWYCGHRLHYLLEPEYHWRTANFRTTTSFLQTYEVAKFRTTVLNFYVTVKRKVAGPEDVWWE
jgi:hypothetical protein